MSRKKHVNVAVGVVLRQHSVFVCLRPESVHQGNLWEFPGGKLESGETSQQALHRELHEEIGIDVLADESLCIIEHDYGDRLVALYVHLVTEFKGEPHGKEGQRSEWQDITHLDTSLFPAANADIISQLKARFSV